MHELWPDILVRESKMWLFNVFAVNINQFEVPARLSRGPEFSCNYLINYTVGFKVLGIINFLITTEKSYSWGNVT